MAQTRAAAKSIHTLTDDPLDTLCDVCDEFVSLEGVRSRSGTELLHTAAASLHRVAAAIAACEETGMTRSDLLPHLAAIRALHSQSPFVERLQTWPRGYPGDFETVEWLCDADNRAPTGTVSWAIEEYALQSPVAQQHRNKVGLQAKAVLSTLLAHPDARIASLGCGGCRDLSLIQELMPGTRGRLVLVDLDEGALAFARERLSRVRDRCDFIPGRVPRILPAVAAAGPFHLVVAGGLFDYLPDRWALATLRGVRRMLAPGGRLLFSNIARGNPFRPWLEYIAEWPLIERDEADVRRLVVDAGFDSGAPHVFRDTSRLALMVDVRTPSPHQEVEA